MTVTLEKSGPAARETDAGMNDGRGELRVIGGLPVRKVRGAVIRLAGAVRCVTIEPHYFGSARVTLYDRHGHARSYAVPSWWEDVRAAFLRYAIANGIYAGVVRMR